MEKKKVLLKTLSICLAATLCLSGCQKKEKKKKSDDKDVRHAEAMLDDFCAYLKSGKLDKARSLIDGESEELDTVEAIQNSPAKEVLDACLKRIDYEIEETTASEDDEEGECTLVITYFDTKEVKKATDEDSSKIEICDAIEDAEDLELEFDVDLTFDDDWLVDSKSVDSICKELFSFLEMYGDMTEPTDPPKPTSPYEPFEEYYSVWYSPDYNELKGIHESDDYVRYYLITYDYYTDVTVTFAFEDEYGNVLYDGEFTIFCCDDVIECVWQPSGKIPTGTLYCKVYDPDGTLFSCGSIEVYADGEYIPVDIYMGRGSMIDANEMAVPGYHVGDKDIGTKISLYADADEVELLLYLYACDSRGNYSDDDFIDKQTITCDLTNYWDPYAYAYWDVELEEGFYIIMVYDVQDSVVGYITFQVVKEGEPFEYDDDSADYYDSYWLADLDDYEFIDYLTTRMKHAVLVVITEDYYDCMGFEYELVDANGKTLAEGLAYIVGDDDTMYLQFDFDSLEEGELTCTVYNPNGTILAKETIEVKK